MCDPDPCRPDLDARLKSLADAVARLEARTTEMLALLSASTGMEVRRGITEPPNLEADFLTRHRVQLIGCDLIVNSRKIKLSMRQAVLIAILIRHALSGNSGFLSTPRILEQINARFAAKWPLAVAEDIHETVYKLRRDKLHLEQGLLESSAARGEGLRISTARENIELIKSPCVDCPSSHPLASHAKRPITGNPDDVPTR